LTAEDCAHITSGSCRRPPAAGNRRDLDPAMLKARITASFGKLPRGDYKAQLPPQLSFTTSTVDVTPRELPTNYIQGMFTAPPLTSPDIYPMRVASSLLRDRVFEESA